MLKWFCQCNCIFQKVKRLAFYRKAFAEFFNLLFTFLRTSDCDFIKHFIKGRRDRFMFMTWLYILFIRNQFISTFTRPRILIKNTCVQLLTKHTWEIDILLATQLVFLRNFPVCCVFAYFVHISHECGSNFDCAETNWDIILLIEKRTVLLIKTFIDELAVFDPFFL